MQNIWDGNVYNDGQGNEYTHSFLMAPLNPDTINNYFAKPSTQFSFANMGAARARVYGKCAVGTNFLAGAR